MIAMVTVTWFNTQLYYVKNNTVIQMMYHQANWCHQRRGDLIMNDSYIWSYMRNGNQGNSQKYIL